MILWQWALGFFAVSVGLAVLFFFDPTKTSFYPKCFFHTWTGLSCPGCGATRAAFALLHGNWGEAFRFNPLLILFLPLLFWMFFRKVLRDMTGRILPSPFERPLSGWIVALTVILFAIIRNLPFAAFAWMSH